MSTDVRDRWLRPWAVGLGCVVADLLVEVEVQACDMLRVTNHCVVVVQVAPWEISGWRGEWFADGAWLEVEVEVGETGEEAETRKGMRSLARSLVTGLFRERDGGEAGLVMLPMVGSRWTLRLQGGLVALRLGLLRERRREGCDAGKESVRDESLGTMWRCEGSGTITTPARACTLRDCDIKTASNQ